MRQLPTWNSEPTKPKADNQVNLSDSPFEVRQTLETKDAHIRSELIKSLKSPKGGYTKQALATIGVSWPPKSGWKANFILTGKADSEADEKLGHSFEYIMRLLMNNNGSGYMTPAMDLILEDYQSRQQPRAFWAEYLEGLQ
jgi:hypothetical protein